MKEINSNNLDVLKNIERLKTINKKYKKCTFIKPLILSCIIVGLMGVSLIFSMPIMLVPIGFSLLIGYVSFGSEADSLLKEYNNIVYNIGDCFYTDAKLHVNLEDIDNVEIVPTKIRVGDDVSKRVAIEVFKEGKYIVMKDIENPVILRVYENNDGVVQQAFEPTDEDLKLLTEELPEFEYEIGTFKKKTLK